MRFKTNLKSSLSLIDLTPLVDVIFLMLIFFIVTSDVLPLKSLHIENPTLEKKALPLTTQLLLVVDAHQVLYVGSKKSIVDLNSLKKELEYELQQIRKLYPGANPNLVLSVDKQVPYDFFLKVFSIAQEVNSRIRLVYKQNDEDF